MFVLALVIGLLTGSASWLLKWSVGSVSRVLTHTFGAGGPDWFLLFLPVAGIALAVAFQKYVIRRDIANGVDRIRADLADGDYRLPASQVWSPLVASTFTLGFGGSAGSEGPIASTGAAIGSNMARLCGMKPQAVLILLGCGAGAGIAGIFKAPVGGVLFTLECLGLGLSSLMVLALFCSCLTSALTAYILEGCTVDIPFAGVPAPLSARLLLVSAVLGLVCGVYSVYYSAVMSRVARWLHGMTGFRMRALVSGVCLSVLVFLFPSLYGEGYGVLTHIVNDEPAAVLAGSVLAGLGNMPGVLLLAAVMTVMLKCFATSLTNNGGGVAGDFAPTLFAGCFVGLAFGLGANAAFGLGLPAGNLALFGMAGVMAGAVRAPLMAIFLTVEMTASYGFLLPVTLVATVSYGVVWVAGRLRPTV